MMSKKTIWATIWLCSSTLAFAQDPNAQKFAGEINVKTAKKHLYILASDKFEGRETGKPGAEKAANYIANEFKKLKLTAPVNGSYFQNVPLVETSFEVSSFVSNGKSLSLGKDFLFSGSGGDPKSVNVTEITFIGYGIGSDNYDDLKNTSIAGKVVLLINKGEPMNNGISAVSKTAKVSDWSTSRFKRLQYVMSKSPSLILAVSPDVAAALQSYAPRNGRLSIKKESTPASRPANAAIVNITPDLANQILQNSGKTYDALKASIDNSGKPQTQALKAEISMTYGPVNKEVQSVNVLGYLEGTDLKDELVVYSAHYDHIGITTDGGTDKINNGADDDGSGITGVLSIARAFAKAKKAGHGPRRSVLFLMVTGEEKGLLGSEYYSLNPVYPMANTITNLNIDMIGRTGELYKNHSDSTNYCYLIGSDKLSTDLHKISENANAVYTKMKIDYKYNDPNDPERFYYRSDHYNFAKNGVPIVFYFNGVHEDYHKPSDEVSKINFELLSKRAQLVYYTGWDLLNRDKRPVVDVKNDMPATR